MEKVIKNLKKLTKIFMKFLKTLEAKFYMLKL